MPSGYEKSQANTLGYIHDANGGSNIIWDTAEENTIHIARVEWDENEAKASLSIDEASRLFQKVSCCYKHQRSREAGKKFLPAS